MPYSTTGITGAGDHPAVLAGWLNTICFDEPEKGTAGVRHYLGDEAGRSTEIFINAGLFQSKWNSQFLAPRFAEISGTWVSSGAREGLRASLVRFDAPTPLPSVNYYASGSLNAGKAGPQPWLVILCKFADVSAEPKAPSYFQDLFSSRPPGLDHYWREVSYNAINLGESRVVGWYVLPRPHSYYVYGEPPWLDLTRAMRDATAAADPDVYFPSYAGISLVFNDFLGAKYLAFAGLFNWTLDKVSKTWGVTFMPHTLFHFVYSHEQDANHHVFAHEMGHALGLPHSSGSYGDTYDNFWDVMSHWGSRVTDPIFGLQAIHTTAYHKDLLGWIGADEKYLALPGTQRTIHLGSLALPQTQGFKMAQIPLPSAHARFYTAEARQRVGYDAGLYGDAVILHDVDPNRFDASQWGGAPEWRPSHVIDSDQNGFTGDDGAMFVPGKVFSDPANGISIAVESHSDSGFTVTINNNAKFLSHFTDGAGGQSTLVLMNSSISQEASGTVRLFASNGDSLRLAINGLPQDGSFRFHLPRGGIGHYALENQGELQTGSIEVGSNSPVEAWLLFAGKTGIEAISASSLSTASLVVPVESDPLQGRRSGLAFTNPNSQGISVSFQVRSPDGKFMPEGSASVSIAAHGQFTAFVDEVFPQLDLVGFQGTLVATSSLPFNGVAILRAGPGQVANLPVGPVDRISKARFVGAVTTFAGEATTRGSDDGTLQAARFSSPNDIAADKAGNLYVADTANHTIRKITPQGLVITLAGLAGSSGSQDGAGELARFSSPRSVCVDDSGALFIADSGNHIIRKLTPDGAVTTVAGLARNAGSVDGTVGLARFNSPRGIAADKAGTIYVSDSFNHAIRKIAPEGTVTTLAGLAGTPGYADGSGADARFDSPQKIALDSNQSLLVADYNNCIIRKVSSKGIVTTLAGTPGLHGAMDGPLNVALFSNPLGIAIDSSDNAYVSDGWVVRQVAKDGSVRTLAGCSKINTTPGSSLSGSADGTYAEARFAVPAGLTMHPSGALFVADRDNHTIRRLAINSVIDSVCFPQFVDGEGLSSSLLLINPSLTEHCTGTVELRGSQGRLLDVDLNGAWIHGSYPFHLAPGGAAWLRTDGIGALVGGWAKVTSDIPIRSTILFSGFLGLTGVGAAHPSAQLRIPLEIDDSQSVEIGLAFSNPASVPVNVLLSLREANGTPVAGATANVILAPYGQLACFPRELFTGKPINLAGFRGILEIDAVEPICGMALRMSPGELAALPVTVGRP